jgi:hypothetical protein
MDTAFLCGQLSVSFIDFLECIKIFSTMRDQIIKAQFSAIYLSMWVSDLPNSAHVVDYVYQSISAFYTFPVAVPHFTNHHNTSLQTMLSVALSHYLQQLCKQICKQLYQVDYYHTFVCPLALSNLLKKSAVIIS